MSSPSSAEDTFDVLVWRADLLRGSETFVRNQLTYLRRWRGRAVGLTRFHSPLSSDADIIIYPGGSVAKIRRKLFERTRRSARLTKKIRTLSPKIVHSHFLWDAGLIVPTLRRLRIPLVVTAHGFDVTSDYEPGRKGARQRSRDLEVMSYATTIVAVSNHIRNAVIARGADPEKVVVRHIGIPLASDAQSGTKAVTDREGILFVGRLVQKKGVDILIKAVAALPPELRETPVTIVGDGPELARITSLVDSTGVSVRFLSHQSPAEVAALMERSLIFCGPSRTADSGDSEGLPMVFLEAATHGAAVVSTTHSGIPEAVQDGETGYLVGENDVQALSQALEHALSDDVERQRRADNARVFVRENFDIETCTAALESTYEEAVVKSSGASTGRS